MMAKDIPWFQELKRQMDAASELPIIKNDKIFRPDDVAQIGDFLILIPTKFRMFELEDPKIN